MNRQQQWKPNLLCIVPPYTIMGPPLGLAALMGFLKANQCDEFDLVDFRLWSAQKTFPTFTTIGIFGETYVLDVPDLPLVLMAIRSYRENKPLIDFFDDQFETYCLGRGIDSSNLKDYLIGIESFFQVASEKIENPRFLGFSTWSSNFLTTLIATIQFKKKYPNVFIVGGGPQVSESSNSAKLALASGLFDAVVVGEGERALLELFKSFSTNGGHVQGDIPGVMRYHSSTKDFTYGPAQPLKFSEIPCPDYSHINIHAYQKIAKQKTLIYQMSRGCTDKCSFCSEWVFWKSYRQSEPIRALEHFSELKKKHEMNHIFFADSLLNGNPGRLKAFAEGMIEKKMDLKWSGFMRASMDADFAKLLKKAGCNQVFIGIESLSDETLAAMNKRRTEADNISALHAFLSAGILVTSGLIPGFPGDSRERFVRTASALRKIQDQYPKQLAVNVEAFSVSPGQPMFKNLEGFNLVGEKWSDDVLKIEPELRFITEGILHNVTGKNQGIDRVGEYKIATLLATSPTGLKKGRFSYKEYERRTDGNDIVFDWIDETWGALSIETSLTTHVNFILNRTEWKKYQSLIAKHYTDLGLRPNRTILANAEILKFLKEVSSRHVNPVFDSSIHIFSTYSDGEMKDSNAYQLSPFGAVRHLKDKKLIAYASSSSFSFLESDVLPGRLLKFLETKKTFSEIQKQAPKVKDVGDRLDLLVNAGMVLRVA